MWIKNLVIVTFLSMPYKKQVVYLKKQKTFLRFFPKTAKFLNKIPTL